MKKRYFVLAAFLMPFAGWAQNAGSYTFATATTGSLTPMGSGTTTLVAANNDDAASAATSIGFDFYFQGTPYSRFSVNSNGTLRLGSTAIGNTLYDPLGQSGQALITAYGADQRTHVGDGKVHYKVTGAQPNRVLVVEWLNMQADFNASGTADLTYQVRLYETTGAIEFAYGNMTMSTAGAGDANSSSPQFGFSSGNTANAVGTLTVPQSGTPAPSYSSAAAPVNNTYTAGTITALNPTSNGSRTFSFTPPTPLAPTSLSFAGVAATTVTLNWTDNATNELGYAIYASTDGVTYSLLSQAAANATGATVSSLTPSTPYSFRVYAFTEGGLSSPLSGTQATPAVGLISSVGSGLWSAPATWSTGAVPTVNDAVTIADGTTVTVDGNGTVYTLTVGQGASGILEFEQTTARTLTVYTDATVAAGGTFRSNLAGTQTAHVLSIGRNLTNNGTLDFSTNAETAGAGITFTGAANTTFSGTGPTTDVRQITVNKGTGVESVLEMNLSNFSARSVTTDAAGFLVLTNGLFKVSGAHTYTGRTFTAAAYTLPATAGLWLNNPNFTIAAQTGNAVNNGMLRLSNGTWNIGTTNTTTLTGAAGATFLLEGGTLNVAGRFNPSTAITYTQTGGTVNVATVGNAGSGTTNASFAMPSVAAFSMTGGTINLVQACTGATPVDYINSTTIATAGGGTVQAGTAATATNFNFRIRGNLPNFTINNTGTAKTATITAQVNLNGTTTINPGATLVINGQICLVLGPAFVNNGTLTGTAASTRFYFLSGLGQTTYSGTGTVTAPLTAFEVDNEAGVVIDPATTNPIITARFNNFSGGLAGAGKLTLGNGGTTSAIVQLGVSGVSKTISGFDAAPTFNAGTGGFTLIYAPELTARTTGFEIPPSRIVNALTVSNANGITLAGGDLATNALTMAAGNVTTGSNTLTLGTAPTATGTFTYTSGTIVGRFKRWIAATAGNTDFPVGIATAKRNASVNFTTAPTTGGSLTAQWVAAPGGKNGLPLTEGSISVVTTANEGYWSLVAGDGLAGGAYTGTFTATNISNVSNVADLVLTKRSDAAAPWVLDGTHVTSSGTASAPVLSRTGMSGFSEFGVGQNSIPLPLDLLSFTGQRKGSRNQLDWTTANERDMKGFEIQRSQNGADWSVLGFSNAHATAGSGRYQFADETPAGAVQFYRLRLVDAGGPAQYSRTVVIRDAAPAGLTVTAVYPNPAGSIVTVRVVAAQAGPLTATVTDVAGRTVLQRAVFAAQGQTDLPIDLSGLSAGTYALTLEGVGQEPVAVKFDKQ